VSKKLDYFGKTIYKFCKLLKIKKPILVKPDRRFRDCTAEVRTFRNIKTNELEYIIVYNIKTISELAYWKISYVILHELGHIKTLNPSSSLFENEYKAEKFAYNAIKKHFKLQLPKYLDYIAWYEMNNKDIYQKVFRKLLKEITK